MNNSLVIAFTQNNKMVATIFKKFPYHAITTATMLSELKRLSGFNPTSKQELVPQLVTFLAKHYTANVTSVTEFGGTGWDNYLTRSEIKNHWSRLKQAQQAYRLTRLDDTVSVLEEEQANLKVPINDTGVFTVESQVAQRFSTLQDKVITIDLGTLSFDPRDILADLYYLDFEEQIKTGDSFEDAYYDLTQSRYMIDTKVNLAQLASLEAMIYYKAPLYYRFNSDYDYLYRLA